MFHRFSVLFIILATIISSLMIVPKVQAACDPSKSGVDLSNCFQLNETNTVKSVYTSPNVIVNLLVKVGFVAAGIISFFLMIFAGFQYIAGGTKGAEQAKTIMETALIGFMVMFAAFWIVQIIKVVTGADLLL